MSDKTSILIVEDDMIIAANISLQLTKLGYLVTGIESKGESAINHVKENTPDIILMDINLKGKIDGVDTAKLIHQQFDIPLIYLTANTDDASFQRARETNPYAFISKPFKKLDLERTIALVEEKLKEKEPVILTDETLKDRIFIRSQKKLVKIMLDDITYIEADRNYCHVITSTQKHTLVSSINSLCEKIAHKNFIRVHRSFVVNISKLDAMADSHLEINRKVIPISKMYKEKLYQLLKRI